MGDIKNIPDEFGGVHPLLSTIVTKDPQEREADAFQVYGKLRCPQILNTTPLILEKTTVELKVFSQDSKQNRVLTHQSTIFTIEGVELDGNTEEIIFIFKKIRFNDILTKLDSGAYDSWHEFDVNGNIAMHWKDIILTSGSETFPIKLNIPTESINTFIQTTFVNDVGTDKPTGLDCKEPEVEINGACQEPREQVPPEENQNVDPDPNADKTTIELITGIVDEWTGCLAIWDTDCLQESRFFGIYTVLATVGVVGVAFSGKKSPPSVQY